MTTSTVDRKRYLTKSRFKLAMECPTKLFYTGKSGEYLATMYGYFKDERRYSLVMVESSDGLAWKFRSLIAGFDCRWLAVKDRANRRRSALKTGD
jgi:hypothetical protein